MNFPVSFIWPAMLIFLFALPLLAGLYVWMQRRRQKRASVYSKASIENRSGARGPGIRRHIPAVIFLTGLAILLLATARPQTIVSLPKQEGIIILAFDVSGSMAAEDLKPNRMEAAKSAALDFVQRQPAGVQVGVVAFSGSGLSVQTPTNDQAAILASINRLKPELGTSLAHGIQASLDAIDQASQEGSANGNNTLPEDQATPSPVPPGSNSSAAIVLLTDGENTAPPDPMLAAAIAADRGIRIYTIGIGSAAGIPLEVNGFNVHTRLDEAMLQQISQVTGGVYYNTGNEQDLEKIYDELTPQLVVRPEKMEVTSLLAGASLLLMLVGGVFSLVWFGRLP